MYKTSSSKSGVFYEFISGRTLFFSFQKYKYGPYAHSIDIVGRNIGEYQSFYGLNDTESTYQLAYQVICSEKTTKLLNRLSPAIEKAVAYVNGIESDHELEGLATVTYLVQTFSRIDASQIVSEFKQWSDDKATRFTEDEIKKYIDCLEQMGVIERDIMGKLLHFRVSFLQINNN